MELGWDTRPLSLAQHARDWRSQSGAGPSSPPPPAFSPVSSFSQRRRSSTTQVPPAGPPPNQPIPKVPVLSPTSPVRPSNNMMYPAHVNGNGLATYARPSMQTRPRLDSFSNTYQAPASSSAENLSDPPPRSILQTASFQVRPQTQESLSDRHLLFPQDSQPRSENRPSSRRALTRALELAREAVKLDSTNKDPFGAVIAYGQSVALLGDVMERVRRGEDSTETSHRRRNGRRRSVVAQEEEVRRLKSIVSDILDMLMFRA
jgi:hypothetical protein